MEVNLNDPDSLAKCLQAIVDIGNKNVASIDADRTDLCSVCLAVGFAVAVKDNPAYCSFTLSMVLAAGLEGLRVSGHGGLFAEAMREGMKAGSMAPDPNEDQKTSNAGLVNVVQLFSSTLKKVA